MLTPYTLYADTGRVLVECSQASTDERQIEECLAVSLAQAETALSAIEGSWQRLLELELQNQPADGAQQATSLLDSDETVELKETKIGSKVIDIVNDTALQSGLSSQGSATINVDGDGESRSNELQTDSLNDVRARFGFLPALFRSYRDQHCSVEASLFGADRIDNYRTACLVDQTQLRAKELNQWLAVRRVLVNGGHNYRGYYVKTNSGAAFQACDRKVDWWVSGSDAVLSSLDRRYSDIWDGGSSDPRSALFYAEFRGNLTPASEVGPGSDYNATLNVERINLLRPVVSTDCTGSGVVPTVSQTSQQTNEQGSDPYQAAATVDDYASSGFLYGYFNYWVSACAVTQPTVCSTETEAQFASDGEWQLRLDRSIESDWRVQLIATTDDQVIERKLKMQIDGADVFLGNSLQQPLALRMRQGVSIAVGELARELIVKLRAGSEVRLEWHDESDIMSELKFSLIGVTRALEFFDQSNP